MMGIDNPMHIEEFKKKVGETHKAKSAEEKELARLKLRKTLFINYGNKTYRNVEKYKLTREKHFGSYLGYEQNWCHYNYNGVKFDLSWELIYYLWCIDNGINIIRCKRHDHNIIYYFNDEKHYYYPDFIIDDQYIEIKSDYLMKQLLIKNTRDNAKYNCMIEHNVIILTSIELQECFDYVLNKYDITQYRV